MPSFTDDPLLWLPLFDKVDLEAQAGREEKKKD